MYMYYETALGPHPFWIVTNMKQKKALEVNASVIFSAPVFLQVLLNPLHMHTF